MEEIKKYLSKLLKAELDARNAFIRRDRKIAEEKLQFLNSFFIDELRDTMGLVSSASLLSESFYKEYENFSYEFERFIYKISKYVLENDRDLYIVYLSDFDAYDYYHVLGKSLIIEYVDNEFKVVGNYGFQDSDNEFPWIAVNTKPKYSFEEIGEPVLIERLLIPNGEASSLDEFNKER